MSVWVLDDGPFGLLATQADLSAPWPSSALHVVAEVADSARLDQSGRRQALLTLTGSGGLPVVQVHQILTGSAAATFLFSYLRPNAASATKDLGEHASIALCALELLDGVFVAMDKGAVFLALAELGRERVAMPFDLWSDLLAKNLIGATQYGELCQRTVKQTGLPGLPARYAL